ncbi:predicted O-methyltransferase YrrM [Jatrophihabitans sp. GAS493]|uniref:O-methyltransferase n=1 Tax=Jatrophihabitans sp. GAS493 TaxID=1907575 RepID=UPI000BBFA25B|nr:class I SAM-dependent methyltransferase [Jatrophihabitans sp. GAS493]SOD73023.1 predicted O-methyltransferase YrrM [Jatrophihabitans sp. GAS493]
MADAMLGENSLTFVENWPDTTEVIDSARARSTELGCEPISSAAGAALQVLAAASAARAVVEVGTGAGVSGLWLFGGMRPEGILTTVDVEAEHQRAAKEAFAERGIATTRYRLINGSAAEVLPRLTDAAYDLVFVDADTGSNGIYHEQAVRLLRSGGVVVFYNALWQDRVADPSARDSDAVAQRELGRAVREDDRLLAALLPVGDGLLAAVKR